MFGRKKNAIATYSKSRPVQIAKDCNFPTPEAQEDSWTPSSRGKTPKPGKHMKGSKSWLTPIAGRGSSLALRNISNIPLAKTLSRAPCVEGQEPLQSNRRLVSNSTLPKKVCFGDEKHCRQYMKELQRVGQTKCRSSKKSKMVVSTTTYSSKSMSCCSLYGNATACSSSHVLSTDVKSMSLCKSPVERSISDDLGDTITLVKGPPALDSLPLNSTLIEDDENIELKDVFPQDLSSIIEEPVAEEQVELAKIASHLSQSICKEWDTNEDVPNITPETVSKKECITTDEPKQKRKLAYNMDSEHIPDCVLLHARINKKHPVKLLFTKNNFFFHNENPQSDLPIDILLKSP